MFHFKRFKRSTKGILCALLATFALTATACGEGKMSSSSDDPEIPTCEHDWGEWELVSEPDCTTKGVKQRTCKTDPSHVETKEFSARGHRYDNGICSVCNDGPIFPEAPASIEYVPLTGAGGEFTRYECQEGYYEVTVHQDDTEEDTAGVDWLSFSVPSAGQYALYTVAENDVGITFFTGNAVDIYLGNMTITLKKPAGNLVMPAGTCVCDAGENQSGTLTRREVFRFKR